MWGDGSSAGRELRRTGKRMSIKLDDGTIDGQDGNDEEGNCGRSYRMI